MTRRDGQVLTPSSWGTPYSYIPSTNSPDFPPMLCKCQVANFATLFERRQLVPSFLGKDTQAVTSRHAQKLSGGIVENFVHFGFTQLDRMGRLALPQVPYCHRGFRLRRG